MELIEGSSQSVYSPTMYVKTELYYLLDSNLPSSGSHMVEVTYSGNVSKRCAGAVTLKNVKQQPAEVVETNPNEDTNSVCTNITTQTNGAQIVDVVGCDSQGSFTAGSEQVKRFDTSSDSSSGASSTKIAASAGPTTMSWSHSGANRLTHSVAVFAPATHIISGYILEPNGIPIESVSVLPDSGTSSGITDPNGYYEVPAPHKWSGTVTPTKTGYMFGPAKRTYSNVTTDKLSQDYKDISACDLYEDGFIDWADLNIISDYWLVEDSPYGDINNDGIVNLLDFAELGLGW